MSAPRTRNLDELLDRSLVMVTTRAVGSRETLDRANGFQVAPELVVTCAHCVVRRGDTLTDGSPSPGYRSGVQLSVTPAGADDRGSELPAELVEAWNSGCGFAEGAFWPDLALLRVRGLNACRSPVLLSPDATGDLAPGDPVYSRGFRFHKHGNGAIEPFVGEVEGYWSGLRLMKFKSTVVIHGKSGSPVVALSSGLVVGMLTASRGDGPLGGYAIPSDLILQRWNEVSLAQNSLWERPDRAWLDARAAPFAPPAFWPDSAEPDDPVRLPLAEAVGRIALYPAVDDDAIPTGLSLELAESCFRPEESYDALRSANDIIRAHGGPDSSVMYRSEFADPRYGAEHFWKQLLSKARRMSPQMLFALLVSVPSSRLSDRGQAMRDQVISRLPGSPWPGRFRD